MEIINSLWVERYRPKKLEDLVLPDNYRNDFKACIQRQEVGNLLLSGSAGSGKTALTRIICSKEGIIQNREDNVLELNGSAKESRGISFVQDVIEPYLKIPVARPDSYKIVFIDEADFLTDAAFSSMRNIMEKYSSHARFILTCNYISKIPDAIQSRCQHYIFKQMPVEFVNNYCKNILLSEKITFEEKDVKFIIDNLYPDIRRIVNTLQRSSLSGKLITDRSISLSSEKVIISNIVEIINVIQIGEDYKISKIINNLIKIVGDLDLDFRAIYSDLFFRNEVPVPAKIIINKYSNSHADCLLPNQHFLAATFEIIQVLQKYKQLVEKK
jgi:DNA polymerase III delta prime subunit